MIIIIILISQPPQFKLSSKLAKLLGIHTTTKVDIINGIWQYIKVTDHMIDHMTYFISCDLFFIEQQITGSSRKRIY